MPLWLSRKRSAAFQGINNSAKGWVSSGRLGWPAGMLDALSRPMRASSTWVTAPREIRLCWLQSGQLPTFTTPLSLGELVETLVVHQEGQQVELSRMGPSVATATASKRLCL